MDLEPEENLPSEQEDSEEGFACDLVSEAFNYTLVY